MKALRHEAPGIDLLRTRSSRRRGGPGGELPGAPPQACRQDVYLRAFAELRAATAGRRRAGAPRVVQGDKFEQAQAWRPASLQRDQIGPSRGWPALCRRRVAGARLVPAAGAAAAHGIAPAHEKDDAKLSEAIGKIVREDPSLTAGHDSESGAHVLAGQGALHLRRARETIAEAFGVETVEKPVTPPLRETITKPVGAWSTRHKKQSGGAGQFADVKLRVAPAARGEGFHDSSKSANSGAGEAFTDKDLVLYPNPVDGPSVHVRVQLHRSAQVRSTIFDLQGEMVRQTGTIRGGRAEGQLEFEIPLDGLAAGMYLAKVETEGSVAFKPFAIVR